MTRWTPYVPTSTETFDALASEILHNYGRGRAAVAVDGPDGASTGRFADELAEAIRRHGQFVMRASIDSFLRPRAGHREKREDSAEACYHDSFDYAAFRSMLVEPFRSSAPTFVPASSDIGADAPGPVGAPQHALLLVDGVFLNRPELRGIWNYSIWLDVPRDVALARHAERDGTDPADSADARLHGAQRLYWREALPRTAATAIIDIGDVDSPRRIFADSC